MYKKLKKSVLVILTITLIILAAFSPTSTAPVEPANMAFEISYKHVDRVEVLKSFFARFNSPLGGNAETFVRVADDYKIDYTLLPSIACQESTCAKAMIEGSFNPFGWGIYGDQYIAFTSYDHAIEEVGRGLHEGYFSKGLDTLSEIAPVYTPPSNGSWYRGVAWFTNQIEDIALTI
jgi:hypothetical protein